MYRKKVAGEHLEPLKVNKTEANYQHLLLDMMSKLVQEQRESNRLLKKIAGQTDINYNSNSMLTVLTSPKKDISQSILSYSPMKLFNPNSEENTYPEIENRSILKNSEHSASPNPKEILKDKSNEACLCYKEEVIKKVEGLENVLKNIEKKLQLKQKQAEPLQKTGKIQEKTKQTLKPNQTAVMQSSIGFEMSPSAHPTKKEKDQSNNDQQFNIFDKENVSKRKIDINKLGSLAKIRKITSNKSQIARISTLGQQPEFFQKLFKQNQENKSGQKKNYSILSEILPYSDRREIKIKFSVEDMLNYYKTKDQTVDVNKITEEWLGMVYRATASICWNMLSNNLLSFDQTKILFTENIIFNFIEFMKTVKALGYQSYRRVLVENINMTSVNILGFLCTQYPQTKVQDPNIALRSEIPSIDNKGRAKYDIIGKICRQKLVCFKKKNSGDYTSEIMRVINYMIEKTNEQFGQFQNMMSGLFGQIFLPIQKRGSAQKTEETYEDQMYFEKVKSYTKFLIGRKISKNTPRYAQAEIQNGIFFAKSPSVLRIITKWVEELVQMVRKPEMEIKNTSKQFKDHDGIPVHLYAQVKNGLFRKIKQNQDIFEEKVKSIKRQCYNMEVLLTLERFTTDPSQIHLSEEQISVGKYCTYLKSAIASYICSQLNEVIDFLLNIPLSVEETKIGTDLAFQEQSRKDLDNLNLINCKIFDLLRCKCVSKQSQIVYLLKRFKDKSNDSNDPFKIIRVKDRLSTGTRDILINAQIGKGLICQIQLAVTSNIDKKQQLLDQYNHFLYELKRAKLGAITENASIWSALEQRATFFQSQLQKEAFVCSGQGPHPCITDFKKTENRKIIKFVRPIICASCNNFFEIPRTCLSNIKCQRCSETYCGECHFNHLKEEERKQYVFERAFFKSLFPFLTQYTDMSKPLPRFGFLIRRKYLKKELFYYKLITKKSQNIDNDSGYLHVQLIISVVENGEIISKVINKIMLEATEINGEIYLRESSKELLQDNMIYGIRQNKGVEKVTLKYKELLDNFHQLKMKYVNVMKQPAFIDDLKIFKKPKLIRREMSSFKGILKEDTEITYLKVFKTIYLLQVEVKEDILQKEIVKAINLNRLKTYALDKCNSVSMEFREVTDQMNLIKIKFPPELMTSFAKRLTKLYLNFGFIQDITFLAFLPNIKVLFIRNNQINSLQGVQNLQQLLIICFDNNNVDSLLPLANLTDLTNISGVSNNVNSLNGIQNLTKLKKLNLHNNKIKMMENFQRLSVLKELALGSNPISKIQGIFHLTDLQELGLGKTEVKNIESLSVFTQLKKLSLNDLGLTEIGTTFRNFDDLMKLNLANNYLQTIQNLDEMDDMVELNLRNNKIKKIENLQSCIKLEIIKIQSNFITDIAGIKNLDNLKELKIQNNPLEDCSEFHLMNRKQLKIIFTKAEDNVPEELRPKPVFYDRYNAVLHNLTSSSGSNSSESSEEA